MTITSISFLAPVQHDLQVVDSIIRAQAEGHYPGLSLALDLILKSGGKRIRPSVTLLVGYMLGAPREKLLTLAAAIELLHTATLIHDDLIDNSLLRRGMPTINSQWSPGATVLTGDFFFARAAKLAADTDSIPVMKIFSQTLSTIVNGEITQLFALKCHVDREDYFSRIYAKTASLFETAAMTAALISPANETTIEDMRQYGYNIGVAFQIVDDILDFTGEQQTLGKPVGNDLQQGLVTLPAICYAEANPDDEDIIPLLQGRCPNPDQMQRLIDAIRKSSAPECALKEAEQFIEKGISKLANQPAGLERNCLEDLARFIVHRFK
ncbi:MAG: polyprenyl synthetase family protein [Anaerolineales bacterium]